MRYHKGIPLGDRILWPPYGAERCTCPEAVAAYEKEKAEREAAEAAAAKAEEEKKMRERIKRIVGESGMGDRFLRRTFSTFQLTDDNKRAAAAARRYAEGFDAMLPQPGHQEPGRNGLFIAGPPGTGKTHLAAAIANHLIAQGKPVICMTMIDLLERIKRTYIKTRNPAVFPKKERLGLAQRMMNEASDLVADLMEANDLLLTDPEERELRYRAQRSALRNCRKLIHHIELAHEILSGFSDDAFAYWAKMAAGVKNQTAKWYKTDKERAAKLDAQKRHQ